MKTSIAALGAALAAGLCGVSASGGVQAGAYASFANPTLGLFVDDAAPGTVPGTYAAAVSGASASLAWGVASSAFDGFADGGGGATARADGVAMFTFASATAASIAWSMHACVGEGNLVGWALVDVKTQEPVLGVIYDPLRNEIYSAVKGSGAVLNDKRIRVAQRNDLSGAMLITGFAPRQRSAT